MIILSLGNVLDDDNSNQMEHIGAEQLAPLINLSTDDALNNDFFFDDEFAVPFDANIIDAQNENEFNNESSQMIDSAEIDAIIKQHQCKFSNKKVCGIDDGGGKSDSYLYHADFELSTGSDICDLNMSQDLTQSDKDMTSSELSDNLHLNQKLFTNLDALSNTGGDSYINNSFLGAEGKFDFDCKAAKDNYTINFLDKSASKYSSDSSFIESTSSAAGNAKKLTTWAKQSSGGLCVSNSRSSESFDEFLNLELQQAARKVPPAKPKRTFLNEIGLDPQPPVDYCEDERQSLTTWKEVTSSSAQSNSDDDCDLISFDDSHLPVAPRSKSLPNMRYTMKVSHPSDPESYDEIYDRQNFQQHCSADNAEEGKPKKTSLLQLFQRSKSHTGSSEEYVQYNLPPPRLPTSSSNNNNTAQLEIVSPNSMKRLTGTWSMSSISSGRRSETTSVGPDVINKELKNIPPNVSFRKWGTKHNLPEFDEDDFYAGVLTGSETDTSVSVSAHSMESEDIDANPFCTSNRRVQNYLGGGCDCELSGCLQCTAGSGYMSDSYSNNRIDQGLQWPPTSRSTSIQTSLIGDNIHRNNPLRVVEVGIQVNKDISGKPFTSRLSRMYSEPSVKLAPKQARDRVSQSLFSIRNNTLPDLSFLNDLSVIASGVLRATNPNYETGEKSNNDSKSCQTSVTETDPILARRLPIRSVSNHGTSTTCSFRESSPLTTRGRSKSVSTNTIAYSATSDRGYASCESQLNKVSHWFGDVPENLLTQIPEWLVHRIAHIEQGMCLVCKAKVLQSWMDKDSINSASSSHFNPQQDPQRNSSQDRLVPLRRNRGKISIHKNFKENRYSY